MKVFNEGNNKQQSFMLILLLNFKTRGEHLTTLNLMNNCLTFNQMTRPFLFADGLMFGLIFDCEWLLSRTKRFIRLEMMLSMED